MHLQFKNILTRARYLTIKLLVEIKRTVVFEAVLKTRPLAAAEHRHSMRHSRILCKKLN